MEETLALTVTDTKWTRFFDMHSGGGCKVSIDGIERELIFIEAPKDEAIQVFYHRFGRSPYNVTCDCCGTDYSVDEREGSLADASGYDRNCEYDPKTKSYLEERNRSTDDIILDLVGKNLKRFDKRVQDLYRMAKDKSSPEEARIAMDKLAETDMGGWWHASPHVPVDEFEKTGKLQRGSHGYIIRAEDIRPDERTGHIADPYDW